MDQDFQWDSPYEDPQALNARQGSISYYDFKWWESGNPPQAAESEKDADLDEPIETEQSTDDAEDDAYEIVQE